MAGSWRLAAAQRPGLFQLQLAALAAALCYGVWLGGSWRRWPGVQCAAGGCRWPAGLAIKLAGAG